MANSKIDYTTLDLKEYVVDTRRVSKTVKGGTIKRWASVVVVGDENGHVGYGLGKAAEAQEAIRKAMDEARKNIITVPIVGTTIPHEVTGVFCAGEILLKPAAPGTGIIAGGTVRKVLEKAGIRDIRSKSLRSNNKINVVKATFEALKQLQTVEDVARTRGIAPENVR